MRYSQLNSRNGHAPDYVIPICTFFLVIFGLIMLASASSDLGQAKFGYSYFYLKHQIIFGLSLGIAGIWFGSKFYYKHYQGVAPFLLLISIAMLLLVFTKLGVTSGGAARWLNLGPLTFQPSELLKITFIVYIAAWLSGKAYRQKSFWGGFVPFLIISGLVALLLILQPSTSVAAILIMTALIIYFTSGAKFSYIISTIILGILALLVISYLTPYRWERIKSFLDPSQNTQTSSYQLNQSLIAIGSGGLWGVGFGKSTTKLRYLPQPIEDSIFAIIAEELGFIGSILLILTFVVLAVRIFLLSKKIPDDFGKLLLIGFGSLIAIQTFIHIGAISGILPLTGVPLPYISYGGTALAIFMTISGIIINISKYT
ncbi:MAG: cell division protein FtsW [Candidatus Harrisonbacteria bacterium]|nr:cell division protein FtsW [Candidatus Harrisonbacteria bacterium]